MNRMMTVLVLAFLLVGCSGSIDDFQGTEPELKLENFFEGELVAYGMVQDRSGVVTRHFRADLKGTWNGNEGVLEEIFYWSDGEEQERTWYLTKVGENRYNGEASDVIGVAEGTTAGNALNWVYELEVPFGDDTITVTLDDWMYLLDQNRLLNKTEMTKFGFKVGEITLYIEKLE